MSWIYVGKGVYDTNTPASPPFSVTLPAGTQAGDLLVMHVTCRGNFNLVPPTGWTAVHAVNGNDATAGYTGKPTVMVAYIVRGASAPSVSMSIPNSAQRLQCVILAYRVSAGVISYVDKTTISETSPGSVHNYPQIVGLLPDDLLVLTAGHGATYSAGAARAVTDPATQSPAVVNSSTDGAMSTAAPAAGAWLNRMHQVWSAFSDGGTYFADALKTSAGDTGTISFTSGNVFNAAGAVLAFRASAAGPDTITLNDPQNLTVYEGASGSRTVTFSGSHTGATSTIEIQIERVADSSVVVAWTTLQGSVAAGVFSGSISVPRGGWYIAKVRKVSDTAVTDATATTFGVGVVLGGLGQSHLEGFSTAGTAGASDGRVVTHNGTAPVLLSTTGAAQMAMGSAVAAAFDCPVMWIQASAGGTNVTYWYSSGGGATAEYNAWAAKVTASGGRLSAFVWWQGDFNTLTGDTKSSYTTLMSDLVAKVRLDFTATYCIVGMLGRRGSGTTDSPWQAIRSAHVDFADNTNNLGWSTYDVEQGADLQHFSSAGNLVHAARLANCVARAYGLSTYGRGPVAASAAWNGSVIDVTIVHEGSATDLSPSAAQSGWTVLDGAAAVTVTSAVRVSATKVRLTLASTPTGVVSVRYAWGAYPDITAPVRDNTPLALPMRPTDADIVATFDSGLDGTPPTLSGSITIGTVTTTSIQATTPAGADNVAVTSYEWSADGGTSWVDGGASTSRVFSGLSIGTVYELRVRAKDAAGNVSAALSATQSTASGDVSGNVTLDSASASGALGSQPGTIVTDPFQAKEPPNSILSGLNVPKLAFLRVSDMVNVLNVVDASAGVDGRISTTNPALSIGTKYLVVACNSDGSAYGAEVYTAA